MIASRRSRLFVLLCGSLFLLLGATGCAATSEYMFEIQNPRVIAATPTTATVVFLRPSGWAAGIKTLIFDGRGRFLGESLPKSHFAVSVPPGQHLFISWAENTAALQAVLAPGRVYYVEVSPKLGALSARMHLLAINSRSESWSKLGDWIADTKQLVPDEAAGQAYMQSRSEDVAERLRRGNEAIEKYDTVELEARTLRPEDGR
jgi:hypothetical protein